MGGGGVLVVVGGEGPVLAAALGPVVVGGVGVPAFEEVDVLDVGGLGRRGGGGRGRGAVFVEELGAGAAGAGGGGDDGGGAGGGGARGVVHEDEGGRVAVLGEKRRRSG